MKTIHVLYIEDDSEQRLSLAESLKARGIKVSTAASGAEGIRAFAPTSHDLVLCDLNMPGMGGLEVLEQLRQCCRETPVVVITAHGSVPEAVTAIKQGAQHFILKPVDIEELDITIRHAVEHVRLRNKLTESHRSFRRLINSVPDIVFSVSADGNIMDLNPAGEVITGYSREELIGQPVSRVIYPEDLEALRKGLDEAADRSQDDVETVFVRGRTRAGDTREFEVNRRLVFDKSGRHIRTDGIARDITDRRKAEEALAFSEKRFRGLVENSRGIIASLDPEGNYTYLSPSFTDILGYDPGDFIGRSMLSLLHPDIQDAARDHIKAGFPRTTDFQSADYQMRHKDGHWVWVSSTGTAIRDETGETREIIILANDISHIKKVNEELAQANQHLKDTQSQLVQSEKMASLGMLVAGIAHEINTPIGAVNSMHNTQQRAYSKLKEAILQECGRDCVAGEEIARLTAIIDDANRVIETGVERVTTIVRRLRSFARLDEAELKTVDIHEGLEDTLTLIHHEIKNRIEVIRNYGKLPPIACYPGRLNQVFLNVLNNARQAIAGEGQITITTAVQEDRAVIEFTDTGVGIPKEKLQRIFDPGFTTKGVGVGTGLGLSICYQIIEDHRGTIEAASKVGEGTTIRISLPMNLDELVEDA